METAGRSGHAIREKVSGMSTAEDPAPERLVKSEERVRDLGEVFTPSETVKEMLDSLPDEVWMVHPSPTFLEPACGDGNFLVAILGRKLDRVAEDVAKSCLPAGNNEQAVEFHLLEALSSVYGVDISGENIIGGAPGHELGARQRIFDIFASASRQIMGKRVRSNGPFLRAAQWIIDRNLQISNMLPRLPDGTETNRNRLWIVEYSWIPERLEVSVSAHHFDSIVSSLFEDTSGALAYGSPPAWWQGPPLSLGQSEIGATKSGVALTSRQKSLVRRQKD